MCLQNSVKQHLSEYFDTYEINPDQTGFTDTCDYIELEQCKDISIGTNDLCIMELNTRGLVNKQQELFLLLNPLLN